MLRAPLRCAQTYNEAGETDMHAFLRREYFIRFNSFVMKNTKYIIGSVSAGIVMSLALVAPAFAQNQPHINGWGPEGQMRPGTFQGGHAAPGMRPAVVGQVAAVSGTTITVESREFGRNASTTSPQTYTVDASNATIMKANATSSIASVAVGDTVMVQGTVNGTNITATKIFDGFVMGMRPGAGMPHGTSTPQTMGNGEPVIGGKVASINGTTITITNGGNATYTVDASAAKITKPGVTNASASNISVGDQVVVQGTVNGTSITATSVMDQTNAIRPQAKGFFGSIGSFFGRLFGF